MKRIAFVACLVLGLIGQAEPSHGGPARWGPMCKKGCEADAEKMNACIKSHGGEFAVRVNKSYEECKCDEECHKKAREKMRSEWKEEENKKEAKGDKKDAKGDKKDKQKIENLKRFLESSAKVRNCMIAAKVQEKCLPDHRHGQGSDDGGKKDQKKS